MKKDKKDMAIKKKVHLLKKENIAIKKENIYSGFLYLLFISYLYY